MTRKQLRTRPLSLEGLESRTLMAGNVLVSVTDGLLRVQGDANGNDVQIRQLSQQFTGEWPGAKYLITGLSRHDNTTQTTTINGQNSVVVEGVKNGVAIGLGHGPNSLHIANPTNEPNKFRPTALPGVVTVNTGAVWDVIRMHVVNHNSVTVNSGLGEDVVDVVNSTLRNLTINSDPKPPPGGTAGANDDLLIGRVRIAGFTRIDTGRDDGKLHGSDQVWIQGANTFAGGLSIEARYGSVMIGEREGSRPQIGGSANIVAQRSLISADIGGNLTVTGNNLYNTISLIGVTVGGQLSVSMLGSSDQLAIKATTAASTTLDGGAGTSDDYLDQGENDLGNLTITGFENL